MTIVIQKKNGGVAIMRLVNGGEAETCIAQWQEVNPGEYVSHVEVAEDALPQDRSKRAHWKIADGAVIVDPPSQPIPATVTRRQARQALLKAGKLDAVQPALDAIADPLERGLLQIAWDDSLAFERGHPAIAQIGAAIGLTSQDIDNLFLQAATL